MRKVFGEIIFDFKKNRFVFFILTFQLFASFFVCVFTKQLESDRLRYLEGTNAYSTENNYYRIVDNLVGDYEKQFFESGNAIGKLKIMYSMLTGQEEFEYLEIYKNPIVLIGEDIKDEFLYLYEQGQAVVSRGVEGGQTLNEVKCFWISCNAGESFQLKCQEGRLWKEDEKNKTTIPIVLGSEYAGILQTGAKIEGISPIHGGIRMQVMGILEEGSSMIYNNGIVNLDRYVLVPLGDMKNVPSTLNETINQKILYLFKINGTLESSLPADTLQNIIQDISEKSGVMPTSYVVGSQNSQSYMFNQSMDEILQLLNSIGIMLMFFAIVSTLFYLTLKIEKSKRYYAILLTNGFSMGQIKGILLGTLILPIVIADIISAELSALLSIFMELEHFPGGFLLALNLGLIITVFFISTKRLRNFDISMYLGEV